MNTIEFQGSDIAGTPELPGIYAWYYRPRVFGDREAETLGRLITSPSNVKTEIAMRYDLVWEVDSDAKVLHGGRQKRQPVDKVVSGAVVEGGDLIKSFLQNLMVPYFATPLYIGIASKNLRRRIKQHYDLLTQLWEPDEPISKYLANHSNARVQEVLDQFDLNHSFAINARVKGITPKDLVVCVYPVDLQDKLRNLEQILQILADPICGRG
ncbi:MAG: hypothetical protein OXI24_06690 [Candidatus Poribacteria bacterium]|nr:hypothetical protein [Candidatus Poribacteria bacterium]